MMNTDTIAGDIAGCSTDDQHNHIVARPRRRILPAKRAPDPSTRTASAAALVSSAEPSASYDVGYGRPPKKNQFKKGQSGNPRGRPKGAKSLKTIARRLLTEKISVRTARGENRVTRIEAMMMKLIESASKGDFRALQAMFVLYQQVMPDEPIDGPVAEAPLSQADEATLALFAAQVREEGGAVQ